MVVGERLKRSYVPESYWKDLNTRSLNIVSQLIRNLKLAQASLDGNLPK